MTALMERGTQARTVAATAMNATSSRAHTIVELRIRRRGAHGGGGGGLGSLSFSGGGGETTAKLSLVDLAGSERSKDTKATGARLRRARPSTSRSRRSATASPPSRSARTAARPSRYPTGTAPSHCCSRNPSAATQRGL